MPLVCHVFCTNGIFNWTFCCHCTKNDQGHVQVRLSDLIYLIKLTYLISVQVNAVTLSISIFEKLSSPSPFQEIIFKPNNVFLTHRLLNIIRCKRTSMSPAKDAAAASFVWDKNDSPKG